MKDRIKVLLEKVRGLFNDAQWAGIKEVGRWVVFFVAAGIVTQMLDQIAQVPASATIKVWVFNFTIPIRSSLRLALTMALRYFDKFKHTDWKLEHPRSEKSGGLLPF